MTILSVPRFSFALLTAGTLAMVVPLGGCKTDSKADREMRTPAGLTTSVERPEGAPVADSPVTDRTETEVVQHRAEYARLLEVLARYYTDSGYPDKSSWATIELAGLRRVKTYNYAAEAQPAPTSEKTNAAQPASELTSSLESPEGAKIPDVKVTNQSEVDLVEELTLHRNEYARLLEALSRHYAQSGPPEKAAAASAELAGFRRVKTYRYLMDAEVPRADLKPNDSIAEADRLYTEAKTQMKKSGHGTIIFYNQTHMRDALTKFKELVNTYPSSDKIDDAAYYIGEIHKEYEEEKDNELAIWWYQRAIQWNPDTPHPCRFRIATTYDYRLGEHDKALYWYQQTLEHESKFTAHDDPDFTANTKWSADRIRELTPVSHLRSPADSVGDGRTAPPAGSNPPPPQRTAPPVAR